MIKECNVVYQNELVMVVKYDNNMIQFPSSDTKNGTVFVRCEGEKYTIVTEEDYQNSLISSEQNKETFSTIKKSKKTMPEEKE